MTISGSGGLVATGLSKAYGRRTVVHDLSLRVARGVVHGLLGPNGAGKTTVFRLLAGVERPDTGRVELDGRSLDALPLHRRARLGLGYLPQEDTLFRDLDVRGNVALAASMGAAAQDPDALLERVGIAHLATRRVDGLSGGERRRLEVARLLALSPRLLLLDEPFAGIDPIAVGGLQVLVRSLAASGLAVLVTDHAVRETLAICDRATVMDGGTVQVEGTPSVVASDARARARYLGPDFVLPAPLPSARNTDTMLE
ncbi:MAG: LPS export ABC transporter ATP-binding protein [Pseudomonadota bacterium]|nr:LPS export ABC transporter ATP-binding protein [Pseudomonadota bacterium]